MSAGERDPVKAQLGIGLEPGPQREGLQTHWEWGQGAGTGAQEAHVC